MTKEHCTTLLDESITLGFSEICTLCRVEDNLIHEMINEGVLIPEGRSQETWRFNGLAVKRSHITIRLKRIKRM